MADEVRGIVWNAGWVPTARGTISSFLRLPLCKISRYQSLDLLLARERTLGVATSFLIGVAWIGRGTVRRLGTSCRTGRGSLAFSSVKLRGDENLMSTSPFE